MELIKKIFAGKKRKRIAAAIVAPLSVAMAALIAMFSLQPALTAAGDTWDMYNFITGVTITDSDGTQIPAGGTAVLGEEYTFNITFAEKSHMQFAYNGQGYLLYQLPGNIAIPELQSNLPVYSISNPTASIGTYSVDTDGLVTLQFHAVYADGSAGPANFIDIYTNAQFTLQLHAKFSGSGGSASFEFGDDLEIDIELINKPSNPKITKSSTGYDLATKTIGYTVSVLAQDGDLSVTGLSDRAFRASDSTSLGSLPSPGYLDLNTVVLKLNGTVIPASQYSIGWSSYLGSKPIFDVTFNSPLTIPEGQSLTMEYTIDITNFLAANYNGNYTFMVKNEATVKYNDSNGNPKTETADRTVNVQNKLIAKTGELNSNGDVDWKINLGNGVVNIVNLTVYDELLNGFVADNRPSSVHVALYDANMEHIFSNIVPTVLDSGTTFHFTIPNIGTAYYAVITFTTPYDSVPANSSVQNRTYTIYDSQTYESSTSAQVVGMDVTANKLGRFIDEDTIEWTVDIAVPASMYNQSFTLTDSVYAGSPSLNVRQNFDEIDLRIFLNGTEIAAGEDPIKWRPEVLSVYRYQISFNNAPAHQPATSLWLVDTPSVLTLKYITHISNTISTFDKTLAEYMKLDNFAALNEISLYTGGARPIYVNADIHWPVSKTNTAQTADGDDTLFSYEVRMRPLTELGQNGQARPLHPLFEANGSTLVKDTFDERLEYEPGSLVVDLCKFASNKETIYQTYRLPSGQDADVNGSTLSFSLADMQLDGTTPAPNWYTTTEYYFVVRYQLRLPNSAEITDKLTLKNTYSVDLDSEYHTGTFESDCTVVYGKPVVEKTMLENYGSTLASFQITLNPDGKKLVSEEDANLLVTDTMSDTMAFYLSSIKVFAETTPGSGVYNRECALTQTQYLDEYTPYTWTMTGDNQITFVLPDETPLRIVYEALIKGRPGNTVALKNLVEVRGGWSSEFEEAFFYIKSMATGGGDLGQLTVVKNASNDADTFLPGAVFALYVGWAEDDWVYGQTPTGGEPATFTYGGLTFYYLQTADPTNDAGMAVFDSNWLLAEHGAVYALVELSAPPGYEEPMPLSEGFDSMTLISYNPRKGIELGLTVETVSDYIALSNVPQTTQVEIPGEKRIRGTPLGADPDFTFRLVQVTDETGSQVKFPKVEKTAVCSGAGTFRFDLGQLPIGIHYYRITEDNTPPNNNWTYDNRSYVVRVDVYYDSQEDDVAYSITDMDRKGEADIRFTNLYGPATCSLQVTKTVTDPNDDTYFFFTLRDSNGDPVDLDASGITITVVEGTGYVQVDLRNGQFSLTHGTVIRIDGLQVGVYTLTEDAPGYFITYKLGKKTSPTYSNTATCDDIPFYEDGDILKITFTNSLGGPILPATGGSGGKAPIIAAVCIGTGLLLFAAGVVIHKVYKRRRWLRQL